MSSILIDTNVIVFLIEGARGKGQAPDLQDRAELLVDRAAKEGKRIIFPAVCMAELLPAIPEERFPEYLAILKQTGLDIKPFDVPAALQYGRVFPKAQEQKPKDYSRKALATDAMIVSIALANGVDIIYSHNTKDFQKWTRSLDEPIHVRDIPSLAALVAPMDPNQLILSNEEDPQS